MAARFGTMLFKGVSGKVYSVDIHIPDAVATKVTFNGSGLSSSTSSAYWTTPEQGAVIDISAAGAPTAVGAIFTLDANQFPNECIRWANQSNALNNRPKFMIPVRAGVQLGMLQF